MSIIRKKNKTQDVIPQDNSQQIIKKKHNIFTLSAKIIFWFSVGAILGILLVTSIIYILFQQLYTNRIYPGVMINGVNFGGKTQNEVRNYFNEKNAVMWKNKFTLTYNDTTATISAKSLNIGYDANLLAVGAYSIGRSKDPLSNLSIILQAYVNGVTFNSQKTYNDEKIHAILLPVEKEVYLAPVDAIFTFANGRVSAFRPSADGQQIDEAKIKQEIANKITYLIGSSTSNNYTIPITVSTLKPKLTTDKVNNLGITDLLGQGESQFQGSIDSRIYNIELAASRINGALVAPGDTFSFDQTLGDVTSFTGYKQAYVIQNGKTVLGDGGGVCQVSTTVFRAILNSGLPVVERHAHAYRVEYYEEDSPPGIDATIYVPTVDLKFKNDTGHYILIQTAIDPVNLKLTVSFYGTSDGRIATVSTPVITSQTPAPPALYQNDPSLPKGTVKQTDFSANGANVYFTRKVVRNGVVLINETFTSNYQPWQAVFEVGTG